MTAGANRADTRYSAVNAEELTRENAALRQQLEEAEETLRAIQTGAVDAVVISETGGNRISGYARS